MTINRTSLVKIAPLLWLACVNAAYAEGAAPAPAPTSPPDSRIRTLRYNESDVYTIRTKYGYQTNIVFAPEEEIQTISVGDRSLWQIIPAGNRLFIRPMNEGITTNMTLLTSKHSYEFDLQSVSGTNESNIYVARFTYPDKKSGASPAPVMAEPAPAPQALKAPKAVNPAPADMRPLHPNYNYTYAGPDAIAPLQVYDDGRSTFIKYRRLSQPLPAAFAVANGKEYPIVYTVRDSSLVFDSVVGEMVLRDRNGVIRVYNELQNPR